MFEDNNILGVIWDGTGYGDDGNIWGGEFFKYSSGEIQRLTHFEYFNWISGDKISKEPRLSLFSLADESFSEVLDSKFTLEELKVLSSIKKSNKLKTSSVGRLFDAVASLLNITAYNTYEGEAAILLENVVEYYDLKSCKSYLNFSEVFSAKEIILNIYKDILIGSSSKSIIANFLFTLANFIVKYAEKHHYKHIAFSGGVFQNTTLVDMLIELAPKEIKLYFHKDLSPNDENSSFGQLMFYLKITNYEF